MNSTSKGEEKQLMNDIKGEITKVIELHIKSGKSLGEISEEIGIGYDETRLLIIEKLGKLFRDVRNEGFREECIRVKEGKTHFFRVRKKYGLTPCGAYSAASRLGMLDVFEKEKQLNGFALLDLRDYLEEEGLTEFGKIVEKGMPLHYIAKVMKYKDRQFVEQQIKGLGLFTLWEIGRSKIKDENAESKIEEKRLDGQRAEILRILEDRVERGAVINDTDNVETIVEKSLVNYLVNRRKNRRMLDQGKLEALFREYFTSKQNGQEKSIYDLAEKSGYRYSSVDNLLKRFGLKPISHKLLEEQKTILERGKKTHFSARDIRYFGRVDFCNSTIWRYNKNRRVKRKYATRIFLGCHGTRNLAYHEASQIYQAQDLGFTRREMDILFPDFDGGLINKALEKKESVSQEIVKGLKTIYPERNIAKPYI